ELLISGYTLTIPQSSPPAGQAQSQQQTQQEGKALPKQAKKSDITKLEKQAQAYGDAWNKKDSQKTSRLVTSNAAVLSPSGETSVGRQEIEKAYSKELENEQLKDAQ